ncbi:hypothetical protein VBD025_15435 [Virgibacillus flavescens]|uniref:hypothetical protein n=1 Tax=Virgibacillus flavescens TaxID=1611422 RepID=UPI003D354CC3
MNNKNNRLEKEIDNYIGTDPLVTSKDKERFNEWLQQPRKNKRIKHFVPAVLTLILCIGVAALLFTVFNNQNSSPTIEQLTAEYPEEVKEKIAELPESIQEKLVVPTDLPSDSYNVQFSYESVPINDPNGEIIFSTFLYIGENPSYHLMLTSWYQNASSSSGKSYEQITLDNGVKADIVSDTELKWRDKEGDLHELTLLEPPDVKESQFTVEDLIEVANSVE